MSEYISALEAASELAVSPTRFAIILQQNKLLIPVEVDRAKVNPGLLMFAPRAIENFYADPIPNAGIVQNLKIHRLDWDSFKRDYQAAQATLSPEAPQSTAGEGRKAGGSNKDTPRIEATEATITLVSNDLDRYLDLNGKIRVSDFCEQVKISMASKGTADMFHESFCRKWAQENLGRHKLGVGEKLQPKTK